MVTTYEETIDRLNDSVDFIEIKVENKLITVEAKYLGAFEIFGIRERIVNSMGEITKLRVPDFVMMEIHESLIGEIEALYNKRIDIITVVFKNNRTEKYVVPLVYHHFRVTSTGDLRIELGQRPCMCLGEYNPNFLSDNKLYSMTEHMLRTEFTPGYMFGKNKVWNTENEKYQLIEEKGRMKTAKLKKDNNIDIVNEKTMLLKMILNEIYSAQKNMSLERLIALATLVDIEYQESVLEGKLQTRLDISQYTEITVEGKEISNIRIESLFDEIKNLPGDRNKNLDLMYGLCIYDVIEKVCNNYKKITLKKLIKEVNIKAAILDFNTLFSE